MNALPQPSADEEPGPRSDSRARGEAGPAAADWDGITLGRWRSTRLSAAWSWPVMVILVLGAAWWFRHRPADGDLPTLAIVLLAAVGLGSLAQTLLRLEIAYRDGQPAVKHLVLTPIGYRAGVGGGAVVEAGGENLRVAGGPAAAMLAAAFLLILVLRGASAGNWFAGGAPVLEGRWEVTAVARVAAWVWMIQGVGMLLPIPGSAGRQVLWTVVQHAAANGSPQNVGRRVDKIQGLLAVLLAAAGLWLWQRDAADVGMPIWPFLIALAVLVWAGRGNSLHRPAEASVAGTPASMSGRPGRGRGGGAARGLSWWKRLRIRQVQRAERGEAVDASRLDEVLLRLHRDGFDSLSAADRMLLRRVSQRLRQRRGQSG